MKQLLIIQNVQDGQSITIETQYLRHKSFVHQIQCTQTFTVYEIVFHFISVQKFLIFFLINNSMEIQL